MSVKSVFGSKAISAGQYRLRLSSSANTVTLTFTITRVLAGPRAGHWVGTVRGPVHGGAPCGSVTATGVNFDVSSNSKTVWELGFHYDWIGTPAPCPQ